MQGSTASEDREAPPRILKFQPNHFEKICEIENSVFSHPFPRRYMADLARLLPETFLVAQKDDKVLGYVVAETDRDQAHILSIAVREDWRRRRVASRLMDELLETLRRRRMKKVLLEVRDSNFDAKALYEKLGFVLVGRVNGYYDDGENALRYSLKL